MKIKTSSAFNIVCIKTKCFLCRVGVATAAACVLLSATPDVIDFMIKDSFASQTNNRHRFSNEQSTAIQLDKSTPTPLLEPDLTTYKKIFDLQERGLFISADELIPTLNNQILLPYILYQRYMHPDYKDKYSELKDWLSKYSDIPDAAHIYDLAVKRAGSSDGLKKPSMPKRTAYYTEEDVYSSGVMYLSGHYHLTGDARESLRKLISNFRWALRNGYTKNARLTLEDPRTKKMATFADYYKMSAHLAYQYFIDSEDDLALKWAVPAAEKLEYYLANWVAGLVYYRKGDYENSKKHFKKMMAAKDLSTWDASAAAFWAYKTNELMPDDSESKERGKVFLTNAAAYSRTIYGMLANARMGRRINIDWDIPSFSREDADNIIKWEGGVRAIALIQLGYVNKSTREFRQLIFKNDDVDDALVHAVMAFAEANHLPSMALGLAPYLKDSEGDVLYNACLYPEIKAEPEMGWQIDRALVFALIRQESRFGLSAESNSGAIGLMQIMPSTAAYVEKDSSLRKNDRYRLYNPEYNLALGQKYLLHLMNEPYIENSLIKILVAYNAGPGNLRKWEREINNPKNDPLFFIEALRATETRIYVKRVMTNLWLYRDKFRQNVPSLNALADGMWPEYIAQDN